MIRRAAGIVGIDPGGLSIRDLFAMCDARMDHDWNIASAQMSLLANINRDTKEHPDPIPPEMFHPMKKVPAKKKDVIPVDISALKMFVSEKT